MEEWHRLREEAEKMPTSEYNVFRSGGVFFTVVRPPFDNGPPPGLIYWNDRKVFLSGMELSESIVEINDESFSPRLGDRHPFFEHPRWARLPQVYFKGGIDGYELGLEVQDDWWKHLCESAEIGELSKIKTYRNHLCGTTRLTVATLPYSELNIYYHDVWDSVDRWIEWEKVRNKQLEAHGWKREDGGDSEIRDPWSNIKHKYFTVSHRGL
jgi:hypothetical protein